ncbi:MAG: PD-(D/E)XK nuclease family protein [Bifidobacteriaceae bacterium]|jgi:superfamily I DNA/RNA helicase/RecB family exonuclease|nr:PD-(D/E)XK nuclease family protein [Bifidobacteriaceae bacterium]
MTSQAMAPRVDLTPPALARVLPDASQEAVLGLVDKGGHVTVFGAPGTGKTLVAELAAVGALRAGRTALVLAPNRHAARALSSRIVRRAGLALAERVAVTASALAMSVLRVRAEAIAAQPWAGAVQAARGFLPQMVTGAEQLAAFAQQLEMEAEGEAQGVVWPESVPAEARRLPAFRAELRDLLTRAAERGLEPADLAELGARQARPDWVAAAHFYQRYLLNLAMLRAQDSGLKLDAAAMVAVACERLKDWCAPFSVSGQEVVLDQASRPGWDLAIVDDYQEASLALHRLVAQLGAQGSQLLVLGSPQSAAQGYRGALPALLAETLEEPAAPAPAAGGPAPELGGGPGGWGGCSAVLQVDWRQRGELAACAQAVRQRVRSPGAPRAALAAPQPPAGGLGAARGGGAAGRAPGAAEGALGAPGGAAAARPAGAGQAAAPAGGLVRAWTAKSSTEAGGRIARRLRRARIVEGMAWDQMAVLARTSGQVELLRALLASAGVPVYVPGSEVLAVDQPAVEPLVQALRVIAKPELLTPVAAAGLLTSAIGGLDAADLRVLRRHLVAAARAEGVAAASDDLLVAALGGEPPAGGSAPGPLGGQGAGLAAGPAAQAAGGAGQARLVAPPGGWLKAARGRGLPERIAKRAQVLAAALEAGRAQAPAGRPSAASPSVEGVLWAVWDTAGLADKWRRQALAGGEAGLRADADLDAVLALFAAASRHDARQPGSGVDGFAALLEAQEVPSDTIAQHAPPGGKVHLSTVTAALGREWDLVALVGLEEDVWPDPRLRDTLLGAGRLADLVDGKAAPEDPAERRRAVLEDEARLLTLAVTRARRELVAAAVETEDETPSRFFDWIRQHAAPEPAGAGPAAPGAPGGTESGPGGNPLPFDLRGVVAAARARLTAGAAASGPAAGGAGGWGGGGDGAPDGDKAAQVLALLAALGVDGAAPETWPGLAPLSTDEPLVGPGEAPRLSPSRLEKLVQCPLTWALQQVGGRIEAGPEASLGTLIHSLAEEFGTARALRQAPSFGDLLARLEARLDQRWPELGLEDGYTTRGFAIRARQMARNLAAYLDSKRDLADVAVEARIEPDRAGGIGLPVRLSGVVDRIETDRAGRVQVVDFKTGQNPPSGPAAQQNPQLGAYQLALEAGLVAGRPPTAAGGAKLYYLAGAAGRAKELAQPPLRQGGDWLPAALSRCAAEASGRRYQARPGPHCRHCPVAASCPAVPQGKQVTA